MTATVRIDPSVQVAGIVHTPGDKSISHRALLLAALGDGTSTIEGLSRGEDVGRTATIIQQLGASLAEVGGTIEVSGGRERLGAASQALDCGNSGTTMRLVMGLTAGLSGTSTLMGDSSLSRRPMDRVAIPLTQMGARVEGQGDKLTPPLLVHGGSLHGIRYELPVPSAQVKSAILLAGLFADGATTVIENVATRPNTEEMLLLAGADLHITPEGSSSAITIRPSALRPHAWRVPGDPSQAAFFIVAGLLASKGAITVPGLYGDPTRTGFLTVLERMGGSITRGEGDDLEVEAKSSNLRGTEIHSSEIPSVDEVPILAVAAAAASGTTRFIDVGELRIKESDRFSGSLVLAQRLGATAFAEGDDLIIEGLGSASAFVEVELDAHGDHRMAMAAAIAGLVGGGATVSGFDSVATSFPGFVDVLDSLR